MSPGSGRRITRPTASGRFLRPKTFTLPESALVPSRNVIEPAPNQFTHRVVRDEPYFFQKPVKSAATAGRFAAGTPVVLLSKDGRTCWVSDGQGLHVAVACASLERL